MEIFIKSEPAILLVQVISLFPNQNKSFLFRCVRCGNQVTRVVGDIGSITPGEEQEAVYTIEQCKRCRENYSFKKGKKKKEIDIVLAARPNMTSVFYCCYCYTPLLQYKAEGIKDHSTYKEYKIPFIIDCRTCHSLFNISDIVTESAIIS